MMDRKKTIERLFLNAVLSAIDKVTPSEVTDDEEPDFVVRFGAECVGVEVTRLHHSPTSRGSRAWEGACEAVLKAAQDLWETKGLPPVLASISFNTNIHFPKNRWAEVAEALVACAQQVLPHLPPDGRQIIVGIVISPWLTGHVECPAEIESISLQSIQHSSLSRTWWTLSTGGAIPRLTRETVQEVIDRKRELLATYRKKAPIIWLIVGMELGRFSAEFTIEDASVLDELDTSGFDRVFVVPLQGNVLYALNVAEIDDHAEPQQT